MNQRLGPVFTVALSGVSVSAAQDVFEVLAPSNSRVRIREVRLGQYSDAGDAQSEMLSVAIIAGNTTTGSGGSTPTARNVSTVSTRTAGSTVKANNTTVASAGSPITLYADAWNVQAGWWYAPGEPEMIVIEAGARLVVRITAPADALTVNATLVFEEIGMVSA